jgi:DNA-binding response OmpR family regulator
MLTAKDGDLDEAAALGIDADDCLTKLFSKTAARALTLHHDTASV